MELKIAFIDSTSKYLITRSVLITGGHFSTNYVCLPVYALLRLMTSDHFVPETFFINIISECEQARLLARAPGFYSSATAAFCYQLFLCVFLKARAVLWVLQRMLSP